MRRYRRRNSNLAWYIIIGIIVLSLFWIMIIPRTQEVVYITTEPETQLVYVEVPQEVTKEVIKEVTLVPSTDFMTYFGEFLVTSYCPCEKCCGEWALNRPTVNNQLVVSTASGAFAKEGVTVAVDTSIIPFGTKLYIEGVGVRVAQDRGGGIKGNRLDVYYRDHRKALFSGLNDRPRKVWIINEEVELTK